MNQAALSDALIEAVADTSRRMLLDLLLRRSPLTPTALAAHVPFTRQAVAKHLAVLDRVGLVVGVRQGREIRYSIRPDQLDDAVRAMERVAARWETRLHDIKRRAESDASRTRRVAQQRTVRTN